MPVLILGNDDKQEKTYFVYCLLYIDLINTNKYVHANADTYYFVSVYCCNVFDWLELRTLTTIIICVVVWVVYAMLYTFLLIQNSFIICFFLLPIFTLPFINHSFLMVFFLPLSLFFLFLYTVFDCVALFVFRFFRSFFSTWYRGITWKNMHTRTAYWYYQARRKHMSMIQEMETYIGLEINDKNLICGSIRKVI